MSAAVVVIACPVLCHHELVGLMADVRRVHSEVLGRESDAAWWGLAQLAENATAEALAAVDALGAVEAWEALGRADVVDGLSLAAGRNIAAASHAFGILSGRLAAEAERMGSNFDSRAACLAALLSADLLAAARVC